jgi:pimeloyl-ACP methyl ester carboxylesterase
MAEAFTTLMAGLGYKQYGVQGGDWGSYIGPLMGDLAHDRVIGVHVNATAFGFMPGKNLTDEEFAALSDLERTKITLAREWAAEKTGYFKVQGTRPQTLSYGLTDSPVGQLAWIVEKFKEWTNAAKELPEDSVARDRLLANVSLYWFTGTAGSSADIYYETSHARSQRTREAGRAEPGPSGVPTGVAVFAEDAAIRRYGERSHNVVHWSDFDSGGHFAAMETPRLLVDDIRAFFATLT